MLSTAARVLRELHSGEVVFDSMWKHRLMLKFIRFLIMGRGNESDNRIREIAMDLCRVCKRDQVNEKQARKMQSHGDCDSTSHEQRRLWSAF